MYKNDVVAIEPPRAVGRVVCFWGFGSFVMAQVAVHRPLGNGTWSTKDSLQEFVCVSKILAACVWARVSPDIIKVINPVQWRLPG